MATSTERSQRRRAHQRGEHSLCITATCPDAPDATPATAVAVARKVVDLRERLAIEAARIADRLDRLDALLCGDRGEWFKLETEAGESRVVVTGVLAEARQQATAFKGLLAEIRATVVEEKPAERGDPLDELAKQRAARVAATSGM